MNVVGAAFAAVLRLPQIFRGVERVPDAAGRMLEEYRDSFERFVVGILEGPRLMLTKCLLHTPTVALPR